MKKDVLDLAKLNMPQKRPSKETLNHPGLIELASGIDPYRNTPQAYYEAYISLGIDLINRVPETKLPIPLQPGETKKLGNGYQKAYLGLYDTYARINYPFKQVEEFFKEAEKGIQLNYNELITPVPHSLDKATIERKNSRVGEIGLYYYMLYTTLFMWGVEYLGWEVFMLAASLEPEMFEEVFLKKAYKESFRAIELLSQIDSPFVFVHDDLADKNGPIFSPDWYENYIFPRYHKLWNPIKKAEKKVIFVADGNMSCFLKLLKETGVDGVMLENPATDFDLILETFSDGIIIGGVDTNILTYGTHVEIRNHVLELYEKIKDIPGFVMSTPGGIHGNIPLSNLITYFDIRAELGFTPCNWKRSNKNLMV